MNYKNKGLNRSSRGVCVPISQIYDIQRSVTSPKQWLWGCLKDSKLLEWSIFYHIMPRL